MDDEQIRAVSVGEVPTCQEIVLVEYDPQWPALFEQAAGQIQGALGDAALQIHHVGSTSVPGLMAKPRIDINLVVADTTDEEAYVPKLEAAGYVLRVREPDWFEHRMFRGSEPPVNLHVFPPDCPEVERMLLFRDWLLTNEVDRELYTRTKRELGAREWKYVQNYADAKTAVVEEILARASATLD
ncbi:MAG TPA: GrpB family protein [Gaiellaceae bacterium]